MNEEIKTKILKYFSNVTNSYCLKVLDNKYREYYTGVTLKYITYHVLKGRYKKRYVAQVLLDLQKDSEIQSLHCFNVDNYVFEPIISQNCRLSPLTGTFGYGRNDDAKNVHKYLNQFINI